MVLLLLVLVIPPLLVLLLVLVLVLVLVLLLLLLLLRTPVQCPSSHRTYPSTPTLRSTTCGLSRGCVRSWAIRQSAGLQWCGCTCPMHPTQRRPQRVPQRGVQQGSQGSQRLLSILSPRSLLSLLSPLSPLGLKCSGHPPSRTTRAGCPSLSRSRSLLPFLPLLPLPTIAARPAKTPATQTQHPHPHPQPQPQQQPQPQPQHQHLHQPQPPRTASTTRPPTRCTAPRPPPSRPSWSTATEDPPAPRALASTPPLR